ncbi:MAG: glycosyltransferase family 2 protein [Actinomycetota bacterium]|nr:glycosyltransferase family 2 protein [Actinomycetota bacterium]
MKLSVIIPCYNEKENILEILKRVEAVDLEKEIIIVDDCSTDGTREVLVTLPPERARVIHHAENKGKGSAIRTGLQQVTGDIVIIQDADLEYDPNDYYELVKPVLEGRAEVVYGSRVLRRDVEISYLRYYFGGRFLSWLTNLLYGANITDEPTCYKVFKADVLKGLDLRCRRFEFCPEVTAKLCKRGYKIQEVPISYHPRSIEQGKKIGWRDGIEAIWTLIKYRFTG